MITLKKHTQQDKDSIIKALDFISAANQASSEYSQLMYKLTRNEECFLTKYDETNEAITGLFVEKTTHKQIYSSLSGPNISFFEKDTPYQGFIMDVVVDYIYGNSKMDGREKYDHLTTLFQTVVYLSENPINGKKITQDVINLAKNYQSKLDVISSVIQILRENNVSASVMLAVKETMVGR